jgi:hypothetical protein
MVHQAFPVAVRAVKAELLDWEIVSRRDISFMDIHDVKPEVNALVGVDLVRHGVVKNGCVLALVFKLATVGGGALECLSVVAIRDLDFNVDSVSTVAGLKIALAIKVGPADSPEVEQTGRRNCEFAVGGHGHEGFIVSESVTVN